MGAAISVIFLGCAAAFVWMAMRTQREVRRRREVQGDLGVGDEVMTTSGIYGHIERLDADHAWIEVAPGITIKMARRAVASKVVGPSPADVGDVGGTEG